jgi:hypothetical protein
MSDLPLTEIAARIADVFLARKIVSKDELISSILPILKIWIKSADKPKRHLTASKIKATLPYTIEKEKTTCALWLRELRKRCSDEEMKDLFAVQNELLKRENLHTYEDWISKP